MQDDLKFHFLLPLDLQHRLSGLRTCESGQAAPILGPLDLFKPLENGGWDVVRCEVLEVDDLECKRTDFVCQAEGHRNIYKLTYTRDVADVSGNVGALFVLKQFSPACVPALSHAAIRTSGARKPRKSKDLVPGNTFPRVHSPSLDCFVGCSATVLLSSYDQSLHKIRLSKVACSALA